MKIGWNFIDDVTGAGDSLTRLLNADCGCRNFVDYLKNVCNFGADAVIDICDENGNVAFLSTKSNTECVGNSVVHRSTYIPLLVENAGEDDVAVKSLVPILNDWQRRYPAIERKLKNQVAGEKAGTELPSKSGKKDKSWKDNRDSTQGDVSKRSNNSKASSKKK